ncbi:MAG: histidine kinase dimerization/phospho-acceptor domain-containing protein [Pseudohongiellaceae bacterium]
MNKELADYRSLFEASPHPYLILLPDEQFTIFAVNNKYLNATGTRRETIVGHGLFEIFPDNPDDHSGSGVSDLRSSLNRVLTDQRQDTMGVQKYDIPLRDGSNDFELKYWSPVNTPVISREGQIVFIIHHVEDVTDYILNHERTKLENTERIGKVEARAERMKAEVLNRAGELKTANRALKNAMEEIERREFERQQNEQALHERDREITLKNLQLKEANRMKSEFLANMSHELRTPLNAIIGFSEIVKNGLTGDLNEKQRTFVGHIYSNGHHLLSLINDILDLSKVEAGRMELDLEPVDVAPLLQNSLSIISEKAALQKITLNAHLADDLGNVIIDARRTKQIVYNLLSNAVKFSHDNGKVSLYAKRVPRSEVGKIANPNWAWRSFPLSDNGFTEFLAIHVVDIGIGISADGLKILFKPFTQIDSSLARKFHGSGLGLVLVRLLAELHGGTVAIESAEGEGSRFSVWLPMRQLETEREAGDKDRTEALPLTSTSKS